MLERPRFRQERRKQLRTPRGGGRRRDGGGPGEEEAGRLLDRLEDVGGRGEAREAEAVPQHWWLVPLGRDELHLICVVDEVAAGAVRTEADGVESAAGLCFVLGVPAEAPQLVQAVGELALGAVLAGAALLEGAAQFRFVAAGDVRRRLRRLADAQTRRWRQRFVLPQVPLDHADRAVDPEGDVTEGGAGQRPAPLLAGGQAEAPAAGRLRSLQAAVELGVWQGHGAEGVASLEAQDSLTVRHRATRGAICRLQAAEILTHKKKREKM